MPTTATLAFSQARLEPAAAGELAAMTNVPMVSGTYVHGQLLGQVTSSEKFTTYNSGSSDGSQTAAVLAIYDMVVDSSGNVTIGSGTEWAQSYPTAPVYIGGYFACEDIPNLTSAAAASLGRIVYGDVTEGLLRVM